MSNQEAWVSYLIDSLFLVLPEYRSQASSFFKDPFSQRKLLRSLMNVCPPDRIKDLPVNYWTIQDQLLSEECQEKGVVTIDEMEVSPRHPNIFLYQGDITRVQADAIVNAANEAMLGCFHPCHSCIDNAIHSASGLQLRQECNQIMKRQGHLEPVGKAKLTDAYNLPSRFVIHTVGPIIYGKVRDKEMRLLESCYRSCLKLALQEDLNTIAFCCISTGEFHFPHELAAKIAVSTTEDFLDKNKTNMRVIFNVFKDQDYIIYKRLLGWN